MPLRSANRVASLVFAVVVGGAGAWAAPIQFGAVGDSFTDEYSVFAPSVYQSPTALNWVDQLSIYRSSEVNFGAFDDWVSAPRYGGYEYNYARLGATTTTLLSEGQHTGVASQPANLVYLGIGTNDFSAINELSLDLANTYGGVYSGVTNPAPLVSQLVANFTTALDTIAGPASSPNGVQVVIGNVGDWGVLPKAQAAGYTNAALRANVTSAIIEANDQILAIAHARGMPVVDVFGLLNLQTGPGPLVIGDVPVVLGAAPTDDQHYFTLPDKIHPGTLWQGLLANAIVEAARLGYGTDLTPFSDQELLGHAGIADPNGGSQTSYFSIVPYVSIVPEPSMLTLAATGTLTCIAWRFRRRVGAKC